MPRRKAAMEAFLWTTSNEIPSRSGSVTCNEQTLSEPHEISSADAEIIAEQHVYPSNWRNWCHGNPEQTARGRKHFLVQCMYDVIAPKELPLSDSISKNSMQRASVKAQCGILSWLLLVGANLQKAWKHSGWKRSAGRIVYQDSGSPICFHADDLSISSVPSLS